ncbi:MAG: pyridoxal-dependent decarboxylase [Candidatus Sumerlaeia bacterium]|nr:pyridoxal-dependent decarboxylase [Candidatus Sumerlaeia bacterium]
MTPEFLAQLPSPSALLAQMQPVLEELYQRKHVFPQSDPIVRPIAEAGLASSEFGSLWKQALDASTVLLSEEQFGHMDTFVHPVAAVSDALIGALNNNPLWREISPYASAVEEYLVAEFRQRLGLDAEAQGIFCSGGSLANLTGYFAGCGGFDSDLERDNVWFFCSEAAHASVKKSAAVLGISKSRRCLIPCDNEGRLDPQALRKEMATVARKDRRLIINAVVGSTLHGAVDPLQEIAQIAQEFCAWLHVDAVYGGNLCYSPTHSGLLKGIERADSLSFAPQKWMFVPRLCAMVYVRSAENFHSALRWPMSYSASGNDSRGQWGIQGSRRPDALTLYFTLQALGTRQLGEWIDASVQHTRDFHDFLNRSKLFQPLHQPQMNLQLFDLGDGSRNRAFQEELTKRNGPWVSLARWRNRDVLRAVLLHPDTHTPVFQELDKAASEFLHPSKTATIV